MELILHLERPRVCDEALFVAGRLERAAEVEGSRSLRLEWQIPAKWQNAVTSLADPFLIAFLFPMMQTGARVTIADPVSRSLVENATRYMEAWRKIFPRRYRVATIHAPEAIDAPTNASTQRIVPFSCGVDSTFTLFRHHHAALGEKSHRIGAAVILNGFDIDHNEQKASEKFTQLLSGAQRTLTSLGIPCIPVSSNFRQLPTDWLYSHGTHLISALHLFSNGFGGALIPNSISQRHLSIPWGSHPQLDPLLSASHFAIEDDGVECVRSGKIEALKAWPTAFENMRVCYSNPDDASNCGRCEKCIITMLAFKLASQPLPAAFPNPLCEEDVRNLRISLDVWNESWDDLVRQLEEKKLCESAWGRAMLTAYRRAIRRQQWYRLRNGLRPVRNCLRLLLRGSTLSSSQLRMQQLLNE